MRYALLNSVTRRSASIGVEAKPCDLSIAGKRKAPVTKSKGERIQFHRGVFGRKTAERAEQGIRILLGRPIQIP